MSETILKFENVGLKLNEDFSLKNINLDLIKGEVHIIMGENGSGKSSLMNILLGILPLESGRIFFNGNYLDVMSPSHAKKLGISMIHQDSFLFEQFTVAENIYADNLPYLFKPLKIISWTKLFKNCSSLFKKLDINLRPKDYVRYLGQAQKQLVEIAKAYVSNASVIIMDEPTSSLTEIESSILFKIIKQLKSQGVSIFYITHRIEDVKEIGDRISVIRNGEITGTQNVSDIKFEKIIAMMSGINYRDRYPKLKFRLGREILKVENLFSGNTLKDISFSLKKHEIFGITGLMGSGRSKIARCIFGIDKIDSGSIYINMRKININHPQDAINNGLGYVTEDRNQDGLFMYLNIPENISSPSTQEFSSNFLMDLEKERDLVSQYVQRLNIKISDLKQKAAYLSGGNQQKLILAKWMMSDSKILIFDEPTKGIDVPSKVDVYNLMTELIKNGSSIIIISSNIEELLGMCDRILVLNKGTVASVLDRSEATHEKILYYATGGKIPEH